MKITEYFSKWRNEWVKFDLPPNEEHVRQLKKFYYQLR